jgi:hypothetical protein
MPHYSAGTNSYMMQILEASLLPLVFVASSFSTRPGELQEHVKIAKMQEHD